MNRTKLLSASLALIAILLAGSFLHHYRPSKHDDALPDEAPREAARSLVRLPAAKLAVAEITSQPIRHGDLPLTSTLPARFAYDDTQHVAVRAPTDGVLESINVKPGDNVKSGETIGVLRSPAVGAARSEVLTRAAEFEIACTDNERKREICEGVKSLAESIDNRDPIESIQLRLEDSSLGSYRGDLLTKYSKALLASRLSQSASSVSETGAISGRVLQQRQSSLQQARAELEAVLDQSVFETQQAYKKSQAARDAAERSVAVARQQLLTLVGPNGGSDVVPVDKSNDVDLARLEIRSPISGTVERKVFSNTERVKSNDELFIIADTSRLWVEADVRERDWHAMRVQEGDQVTVTTPASEGEQSKATVYFVGREVDRASGAVPLVARIDNKHGKYRPGLFARVEVPVGIAADVLLAPASAIVDLDGEESVFVEEAGGFRPVPVETGIRAGDQVEIRGGLSEGQMIVVAGVFVLKSELLLEGEE